MSSKEQMMQISDTMTIQARINGLKSRIAELRRNEAAFIRVSGIDQNISEMEIKKADHEKELNKWKDRLASAIQLRKETSETALEGFKTAMNEVLPLGTVEIDFSDDAKGVDITLMNGDTPTKYNALSGGEKVMTDMAIAKACGANILLIEAAEMDDDTVAKAMNAISGKEGLQAFIFTCHRPANKLDFQEITRP